MFKVTSVRSWNLNAENFDDTVSFYRELLGGAEGPTRMSGDAPTTFVDVGGLVLGVSDAAKGGRAGNPHHMFEIEWPGELADVTKGLEAKGFKVEGSRQVPDSRDFSLTLVDPAGNRIELSTSGRTAMSPR